MVYDTRMKWDFNLLIMVITQLYLYMPNSALVISKYENFEMLFIFEFFFSRYDLMMIIFIQKL